MTTDNDASFLGFVLHWLWPWEFSPTFLGIFVLVSVLYARGSTRHTPPLGRQMAFWLGMIAIYIALHTRLDYYFERQFFLHRLQHLILHHLGPFLIALALPLPTLRAGVPIRLRHGHLLLVQRSAFWRGFARVCASLRGAILRVLMQPVVALVLFTGIIYFWLESQIHFIAMLDWRLYRVMNWSVTVDGLLFWMLVLDPRCALRARLAPGKRVLLALAAAPPQIVLGAYVFFATSDLYPIYALCGRALTGVSALRDQQLGGLILWIPGAMMSAVGALIALRHWIRLSAAPHPQGRRISKWGMPSSR